MSDEHTNVGIVSVEVVVSDPVLSKSSIAAIDRGAGCKELSKIAAPLSDTKITFK